MGSALPIEPMLMLSLNLEVCYNLYTQMLNEKGFRNNAILNEFGLDFEENILSNDHAVFL